MGDPAEVPIGLTWICTGQQAPAYRLGEPHPLYPFLTRYRVECPDTQNHRRTHRIAERDGWACRSCGETTVDVSAIDWRLSASGQDVLYPFKTPEHLIAITRRVPTNCGTDDFVISCRRCCGETRGYQAPEPSADPQPVRSAALPPGPPRVRHVLLVARVAAGEPLDQVAADLGVTAQTASRWYQQYFARPRSDESTEIFWMVGGSVVPPTWVTSSRSRGETRFSVSCAGATTGDHYQKLHRLADESGWTCHYCEVAILDYPDITWVPGRTPAPPEPYLARVDLVPSGRDQWLRMGTADHVVPRSRGGRRERHNIVLACRRCNTGKADRSAEWWREQLAGLTDISNAS